MTDKSNPRNGLTTYAHITMLCIIISLVLLGCSGHSLNKKAAGKSTDGVIYQVTEEEGLELAHWAVNQVLPGEKVYRLKKPRVGYFVHEVKRTGDSKYSRFLETDYFYELDLIKVEGSSEQGDVVTGYIYAIKGNGDLKRGPEKLSLIEKKMFEAFDQSGRDIAVASTKPPKSSGPPRLSKEKPPATPSAAPAADTSKPPVLVPAVVPAPEPPPEKETLTSPDAAETLPEVDETVFIKLKKLKELRDQGIITEEDFEAKKKELLDRI